MADENEPDEPKRLNRADATRALRYLWFNHGQWFFGSHDPEVEVLAAITYDRLLTKEEKAQFCARFSGLGLA